MKELQRKQNIRRILYSLPLLVLFTIFAFVLAKGAVGIMYKEKESSELSRDLEEKAAALILREEELNRSIARLKTEEGIKNEIRERFGVTEAGEHVAIIVDEKQVATSSEVSRPVWYKRLWADIMGTE